MMSNDVANIKASESQRAEDCSKDNFKEFHLPEVLKGEEERSKKNTITQEEVSHDEYPNRLGPESYEYQNSNNNRKLNTPEDLKQQENLKLETEAQIGSSKSQSHVSLTSDQDQAVVGISTEDFERDTNLFDDLAEVPRLYMTEGLLTAAQAKGGRILFYH